MIKYFDNMLVIFIKFFFKMIFLVKWIFDFFLEKFFMDIGILNLL